MASNSRFVVVTRTASEAETYSADDLCKKLNEIKQSDNIGRLELCAILTRELGYSRSKTVYMVKTDRTKAVRYSLKKPLAEEDGARPSPIVEETVSMAEAADILRCGILTLNKLLVQGKIEYFPGPDGHRVSKESLQKHIDDKIDAGSPDEEDPVSEIVAT